MKKNISTWVQIIVICFSITISIGVVAYFIHWKVHYPGYKLQVSNTTNFLNNTNAVNRAVCATRDCNETVKILLRNMNLNADPCENFYEFACGNFVKNTKIPDDHSSMYTINIIADKVKEQVKQIVEEPVQTNDIQPFVLSKVLYTACMNERVIEERGVSPLTNILEKLGGWPVVEQNQWNESSFVWDDMLYKIATLGFSSDFIISIAIDNDLKNNTRHIINIDEATLDFNREYFIQGLENEVVVAYLQYMKNVAEFLGAKDANVTEELREILIFQMTLANLTLSHKERLNISNLYNPISIKEVQENYPSINWLNFINNFLYSVEVVTEDEVINNVVPKYMKEVEKLLNETPKRILANYIIWRTISQAVPLLSHDYNKYSFAFTSAITGISEQPARWKDCVDDLEDSMGISIGALYVRKFFDKESKSKMTDLVKNIQMEFKDLLEQIDWMDNNTRKNALDKLSSLYPHVAYPEELLDDNSLIQYYQDLYFDKNLYFESMLNLTIFETKKQIVQLREPFNKTKWTEHSNTATVNAFYSPLENSIELPAGILQEEFFLKDRPKYMNYGGIGYVIGHEITHGFDNYGRKFDKDGNLYDWWEPATNDAFVKKAQCLVEQYGNYSVGNLTLNGENTLGENIADNGGAKCAYRAYKQWAATNSNAEEEAGLPGFLHYTPEQMVWISMATVWCSTYRSEYLRNMILTDAHSPAQFRVNGVLSNQKEFASDFGCNNNLPMNPENKCTVW